MRDGIAVGYVNGVLVVTPAEVLNENSISALAWAVQKNREFTGHPRSKIVVPLLPDRPACTGLVEVLKEAGYRLVFHSDELGEQPPPVEEATLGETRCFREFSSEDDVQAILQAAFEKCRAGSGTGPAATGGPDREHSITESSRQVDVRR